MTASDHGGDVWGAARQLGRSPSELLDFSANINPLGPPPGVRRYLEQLSGYSPDVIHYPDPQYRRLKQTLARRHGVETGSILVGNGASELIHLVVRVLGIRRAVTFAPTFSEYENAVRRQNPNQPVKVHPVHYRLHQHQQRGTISLPVDQVLEVLRSPASMARAAGAEEEPVALFICRPNNPTGYLMPAEQLRRLIEVCEQQGIWTVIDESFLPFCEQWPVHSLARSADRYPHLIVITSLTKWLALPGLRLGYLITHPRLAKKLEAAAVPWTVNGPAAACGSVGLGDLDFEKETRLWLKEEGKRMRGKLRQLGLTVYPSAANFHLVSLENSGCSASSLDQSLFQQGILIRRAANFQGLDHRFIRLALKSAAANDRLLEALAEALR